MSTTGAVLYETRPQTIAQMVIKIREKRGMNPRHVLKSQDSIPTEIVTQIVFGDDVEPRLKGIRKPKHLGELVPAGLYLKSDKPGRHIALPFRRPTSLFEVLKGEF